MKVEEAARYADVKAEILQVLVEAEGLDPVAILRDLLHTLDSASSPRPKGPPMPSTILRPPRDRAIRLRAFLSSGPKTTAEVLDHFACGTDRREKNRVNSMLHGMQSRGYLARVPTTGDWCLYPAPEATAPAAATPAPQDERAPERSGTHGKSSRDSRAGVEAPA